MALASLWVLLHGCAALRADDSAGAQCRRDPPLTWDNFGHGFLTKHCLACHSSLVPEGAREGAPVGVDFDTYGSVLTWADRIAARAVADDADMPPGGGPSVEERANLSEWLGCGVAADAQAVSR